LFIDASGNVGVGAAATARFSATTSSASVLDIYRTATGEARLTFFNNNASSAATIAARVAGLLTDATAGAEGGALIFSTTNAGASNERLRITSDGKLGLGTSSPDQLLDVAASTGATIQLKSTKTGAAVNDVLGTLAYYGSDGSGAGVGIKSSITATAQGTGGAGSDLRFFTTNSAGSNNTEKARIDELGRVGIGTTGPLYPLHVEKNQEDLLALVNTGVVTYRFQVKSDASFAIVQNATERARIDSSGRLLVGTSSSSSGSLLITQGSATNSAASSSITLARGQNNPSDGFALGILGFSDSGHVQSAQISGVRDGGTWTSGSSQPTRLVFSTTSDSASSPTERLRITSDAYVRLASGTGGIQFNGDTAAANALDDYEEGTWTPSISYSTSNGDRAVVTQIARYTKVGRIVHANINISWTESTSSGNVSITGLPFTSVNIASNFAIGAASSTGGLTGISGGLLGSIAPNATTVQLFYGSTGARVALDDTNTVGAGGQFVQLSISYEAA
jgi:hypothetical protein